MAPKKRMRCMACLRGRVVFRERARDGRPRFGCTSCAYTFTKGRDGDEYSHLVPDEKEEGG